MKYTTLAATVATIFALTVETVEAKAIDLDCRTFTWGTPNYVGCYVLQGILNAGWNALTKKAALGASDPSNIPCKEGDDGKCSFEKDASQEADDMLALITQNLANIESTAAKEAENSPKPIPSKAAK